MGTPTERLGVLFLDEQGIGSTLQSVVGPGSVAPGQVRHYQFWYRDPLSSAPCTARSNLTQALELAWHQQPVEEVIRRHGGILEPQLGT